MPDFFQDPDMFTLEMTCNVKEFLKTPHQRSRLKASLAEVIKLMTKFHLSVSVSWYCSCWLTFMTKILDLNRAIVSVKYLCFYYYDKTDVTFCSDPEGQNPSHKPKKPIPFVHKFKYSIWDGSEMT